MKAETSLYLDAVRFLAALIVFLGHDGMRGIGAGVFWPLATYGSSAVVMFFVLSGFVIGFVSAGRKTTGRDYVAARATRLYSVVVPALLLTAAADWLGARLSPEAYEAHELLLGPGAWQFPLCLFFLNEVWGIHIYPGTNVAYWSLGYEVAYYALFGLWLFGRGAWRVAGCLALALLFGPRILSLLPLWLLGYAAQNVVRQRRIGRSLGWIGFLGSFAAAIAFGLWAQRSGIYADFSALYEHGVLETFQDYMVGLIFATNLVCFDAVSESFARLLRPIARAIRWAAGATFTLYLLHVPLLTLVRAAAPGTRDPWLYQAALIVVPLVVAFAVAQVTERRKQAWRPLFERLLRLRDGRSANSA